MFLPVKTEGCLKLEDLEVKQMTIKELGLKESDLEEFVRLNIDDIFEDETLLIIGQQVINTEKGRCDLVALDDEGSVVLIEIKRDIADIQSRTEPFEIQAIRYAANYATIQSIDEMILKVYSPYISKHKEEFGNFEDEAEFARKKLIEYLKANNAYDSFNKKQRIILIASEFDKQTLSAVAWLITNNVDIACYKINPIRIAENTFLNIERILPKDKNEDYFVAIDEKGEVIRHLNKKINRTIKPRMKSLFDAGILKEKDIIVFKNKENSDAEVVDYKKVIYQGKEMSYVEWGKLITGWSAVCIYEWAKKKGEDKTLDDYRDEL